MRVKSRREAATLGDAWNKPLMVRWSWMVRARHYYWRRFNIHPWLKSYYYSLVLADQGILFYFSASISNIITDPYLYMLLRKRVSDIHTVCTIHFLLLSPTGEEPLITLDILED